MGPVPPSSKRGSMWAAAIPSLGNSIYLSYNLQMGNPAGRWPCSCRRGPCAQKEGFLCLQEGGSVIRRGPCICCPSTSVLPLRLLQVCQPPKLRSSCCTQLCHQEEGVLEISTYMGDRGTRSKWSQASTGLMNCLPTLPLPQQPES